MKFYSDITKKMYDTAEACDLAEKEHQAEIAEQAAKAKKLADEQDARWAEIIELDKKIEADTKRMNKLLKAYMADYRTIDKELGSFSDFNDFLNALWR